MAKKSTTPVKLTTWNINSVRIRLDAIAALVAAERPDILCLQETKVRDLDFPHASFAKLGFPHVEIRGEKSYNGVAILSKLPLRNRRFEDWCAKGDCRHLCVDLPGDIELHNFYVPAGGDIPDPEENPKFAHKLKFLDHMTTWFKAQRRKSRPAVLVGDLNIAPLETDVWSHKALLKIVSHTPIEVEKFDKVMQAYGWIDAVRTVIPPEQKLYSWWSYRSPDWDAADKGRRLDHIWVTPDLQDRVKAASITRAARGWKQASDHAPVSVILELPL